MNKIDVTKCRYYSCGVCYAEPKYIGIFKGYDKCNKHDNCYYKQLQQFNQLKAENEELKSKNNSIHSIADGLQKRNHYLTQENEELKEIRENLHKCNIKIMEKKHNISIKNIKYKQCLHEIEEICKNTELYEWCEYAYSCRYKLDDILQKIKEVKND